MEFTVWILSKSVRSKTVPFSVIQVILGDIGPQKMFQEIWKFMYGIFWDTLQHVTWKKSK